MPKTGPFERHTERYESWFDSHKAVYRSEVKAIEHLIPESGFGIEIGVGTSRFAVPLGMQVGLDPAVEMLHRSRDRGVDVVRGVGEFLPFAEETFDTALIVTTICFVDDIRQTLAEARRVLTPSGSLVIGYIDKHSPVGRIYQEKQAENPFYQDAVFVTTDELVDALESVGFEKFEFVQTVYQEPDEIDSPEPVESGYGDGSFVGIKATT